MRAEFVRDYRLDDKVFSQLRYWSTMNILKLLILLVHLQCSENVFSLGSRLFLAYDECILVNKKPTCLGGGGGYINS